MKQVYRFDADGNYLEPVILEDEQEIPFDCTDIELPQPNWKPVFNGTEWIETATEEEMNPPVVIVKSDIEILKEQNEDLNSQIITLWETLIEAGVI
jgi:hypothetical protein